MEQKEQRDTKQVTAEKTGQTFGGYLMHDVETDESGKKKILATHTPIGVDKNGKTVYKTETFN
jgi:hypothetical protein